MDPEDWWRRWSEALDSLPMSPIGSEVHEVLHEAARSQMGKLSPEALAVMDPVAHAQRAWRGHFRLVYEAYVRLNEDRQAPLAAPDPDDIRLHDRRVD